MASGSLGAVGLLSSIPWVVSAAVGVWGGSVSDFLAQKLKWRAPRRRRRGPLFCDDCPACFSARPANRPALAPASIMGQKMTTFPPPPRPLQGIVPHPHDDALPRDRRARRRAAPAPARAGQAPRRRAPLRGARDAVLQLLGCGPKPLSAPARLAASAAPARPAAAGAPFRREPTRIYPLLPLVTPASFPPPQGSTRTSRTWRARTPGRSSPSQTAWGS